MPKTVFADGDKSQGIPGTRVFAAFLNKIFSHRHDGLDQDGSAPLDYVVDSGVVNAYVANLTPPLTAFIAGMPTFVKISNANTINNPTLKINDLAPTVITRDSGAALNAGDLPAGYIAQIVYNGVGFTLMNPALVNTVNLHPSAVTGPKAAALFGALDPNKVKDTVYQAPSDLVVMASVTSDNSDGIEGLSDGSNPPTAVLSSGRCSGTVGQRASICFVVNKGEYWKVAHTNVVSGNITIRTKPLGS